MQSESYFKMAKRLLPLLAFTALLAPSHVAPQPANIGTFSVLPVKQRVTCIHSILLPGPSTPAPGKKPSLLCVERPHGGGRAKYPPNPFAEPDNSRTNACEVDLLADAGTPQDTYGKLSRSINNPFCGGHSQMADGKIFMAGGDREGLVSPDGVAVLIDGTNIKRVYTPNDYVPPPQAGANWEPAGTAMAMGRWYPTVYTMADSSQIIVGGVAVALDLNEYGAGKRTLNPTYEFQPSRGSPIHLQLLNDTDPWNLYPPVQQMPISGRIWIFSGGPSVLLDAKTGDIKNVAPMTDTTHHPRIYPFTSTHVMLPLRESNGWKATIMVCGGTLRDAGVTTTELSSVGVASPHCSRISPEDPDAKWEENFITWNGKGKVMPDVVLLPDGKLIFVNGGDWGTAGGDAGVLNASPNPEFSSHIYDPVTNTFTDGPNDPVARLYHSGALLLPDGRVITTGSEMANWPDFAVKVPANQCFPGANVTFTYADEDPAANCTDPFTYDISLYTPGYYSMSGKPVISEGHGVSYPAKLTYGSNFVVKFDTDATEVDTVSFLRYGTSTHSTNIDQRFVELPIRYRNTTHLIIDAPINGTIAPPGNWMLFPVAKSGAVGHSATIMLGEGTVSRVDVPVVTTTAGSSSPTGGSNTSGGGKLSVGLSYSVLGIAVLLKYLM